MLPPSARHLRATLTCRFPKSLPKTNILIPNIAWQVYEIMEMPSPWTGRIIGKRKRTLDAFFYVAPSTPHFNVDETRPGVFSFLAAWRGSDPQH